MLWLNILPPNIVYLCRFNVKNTVTQHVSMIHFKTLAFVVMRSLLNNSYELNIATLEIDILILLDEK